MARLRMHRLIAFEDVGVERGEELLVQRGHRAQQIDFGHYEADIQQRRALADHADVDAVQRIENPARHARRVANVLAHQADDHAIVLHRGLGELADLAQDEIDVARVVDGQGDADLARGHHVDGGFIPVEHFEDAAQEAVGHQHARGVYVDGGDLALAGDRFDDVIAVYRFGRDARPRHVGTPRIQNHHRDVLLNRRNHRGRVQHLGAEVGQFGGFGERNGLDAMPAGQNGGVGREHTVHIGPDLDLFGVDASAHDGGGIVAATAARRGGDAVFGRRDEAAHDHDAMRGQRWNRLRQARVGFREVGGSLGVTFVGDHDVARIHVFGRHAGVAEAERDDVAGEAFAVAGDGVDGAWRELAEDGEPFDQLGEFLEVLVQEAVEIGAVAQRDDQARLARVVVAQVVQQPDVLLALAPDGGGGDGEQLVRGLSHGGNHHHGMARLARAHDAGNARDGGGGLHRGAAKLHDDH